MNINSKLRTDVTVTTRTFPDVSSTDPTDFDRYGNPVATETTVSVKGLILPKTLPSVSPEVEDNQNILHAAFQAFFAPTTEINGSSGVSWTDNFGYSHEAEVVGEPQRLEDSHSRAVVIICDLKETLIKGVNNVGSAGV